MKNIWRIILADDEATLRSALRLLLEQEPALLVVGEVAESRTLEGQIAAHSPDLLLLDWELPDAGGAVLINNLHHTAPNLQIIALSSRPETQVAALAAGANAFVCKGDPPDHLLTAIHQLQKGHQRKVCTSQ